jgi:hypothetical protein
VLAPRTRAALRIGAALYIVLGLVLFAAPDWAASNFPWNVSPLVAMTIGGWTLGNGIGLWFAATAGPAGRVQPVLLYGVVFSAAQLLITIAFRSALKLDVILAVPYLLTLLVTLIATAFGLLELRTTTSIVIEKERPISSRVRVLLTALTAFVAALALGGFLAGTGGLSTTGKIFPEPLTLFTVRAFAAFYLALAVGLTALLLRPRPSSAFKLGITGVALIIPITLAALLHIGAFDFGERPLGILYLGAYLVVLFPAALFLWRHRHLV